MPRADTARKSPQDAVDGVTPGQRVQSLRRARGLSLQALSERSNLSIGTLSNIERDAQGLSVRSALALSVSFGVPANWLLNSDDGQVGPVLKRGQGRVIDLDHGIRKVLLNPDIAGNLELLLVTIAPGGTSGSEAYTHGGEEAGHILSGTLALWIDDIQYRLASGDSFHFQSTRPHRFANAGEGQAVVVWTLTPPLYQGQAQLV